jgi:hypothetical protein
LGYFPPVCHCETVKLWRIPAFAVEIVGKKGNGRKHIHAALMHRWLQDSAFK